MYREWDLTNDQLKCELNSGRYFLRKLVVKLLCGKFENMT